MYRMSDVSTAGKYRCKTIAPAICGKIALNRKTDTRIIKRFLLLDSLG